MTLNRVGAFAHGCTIVAVGALFLAIVLGLSLVWAPELAPTIVTKTLISVLIVLLGALFGLSVSASYAKYLLASKGASGEMPE